MAIKLVSPQNTALFQDGSNTYFEDGGKWRVRVRLSGVSAPVVVTAPIYGVQGAGYPENIYSLPFGTLVLYRCYTASGMQLWGNAMNASMMSYRNSAGVLQPTPVTYEGSIYTNRTSFDQPVGQMELVLDTGDIPDGTAEVEFEFDKGYVTTPNIATIAPFRHIEFAIQISTANDVVLVPTVLYDTINNNFQLGSHTRDTNPYNYNPNTNDSNPYPDNPNPTNPMSNLRYRVQLSPTTDFVQPITIDNISGTSIAIEQFAPLYETAYGGTLAGDTVYWRVQEYDTTGEYLDSDWSEVWSMTIAEAEQPPTYGERGVLLNHIGRTMPFSPMHSNRHDASLFHDAATYRFRYQNQRTSEIFYITATKADFPIHAGNVGSQTTSAVERVWQKERGLWNDTDLLAGDQLSLLGVYWNADSNPNVPYVPAPLFHGVTPASALLTVMPQNGAKAVVQSEFKYNDIRGEAYSQNTDGTQNGMIGAWSNLELHNNAIGAVYSERVMISATGGTTYSIPQGFGYVITPEVSADNHAFAGYTIQRWTPGVGYGTVGNGTPVLHTFVAERQAVQPKKLPTPILVSPAHNSVNVALTANLVWRRGEVSWADGSGGGGGGSKEE